jgi:MIP family channel proteins
MKRQYLAEFLATFFMVFAGTGAIVINDVRGGAVTHVGIALTFGLVVMVLIYTVGHVSGAHMNPAVSVAMLMTGKLTQHRCILYILFQVLGAIAASLVLKMAFPQHPTLGATIPSCSPGVAWVFEFLLTMFLLIVICGTTRGPVELRPFVGLAVGATIGLEAMFAGPITGASMNPARSLAPALVSSNLAHLWVYLTAPFAGAIVGVLVAVILFPLPKVPKS